MQNNRSSIIIGILILIALSALSSCKFLPLSIENFNALTEQATPLELGSFHEAAFVDFATHTYRCELEAGETYEINWKDKSNGINHNAVDISVSAQFEGTPIFSLQDGGYEETRTYFAQNAGTLLIVIQPTSDEIYFYESYAIRVKKVVRATLADGEWYNGESSEIFPQHFSFPVVAGEMYELRMNDSDSGDESKTGKIKVSIIFDGTIIREDIRGFYSAPKHFTAPADGFVHISVCPYITYYSSYLGTWGIRIKKIIPVILQENEWADGESTYYSTHLFQITLEAGETYEINWNRINFGDSTKTGRILVSAQYGDTELFSEQADGYTNTRTITPETDDLLSIKVKTANSSSSDLGTWAVRVKKAVPVTLSDNIWTEGESDDYSLHYFTIPVTAGETYEINWDDAYNTNGDKTGTISVTATCNGKSLFIDAIRGYFTCGTCVPGAAGYLNLVVKAYNNSSSNFGTWAVRVKKVVPVTLIDNVWAEGESVCSSIHHLTIPVIAGETYEINWNDNYYPTGGKTGRLYVTATCNGENIFSNQTRGFTSTRRYIPDIDGVLKLIVHVSGSLGTWAVRVKKVVPVTLIDNVWIDGESVDFNAHHFTIPVTAGDTYEINWQDAYSGDGTPTGRIKVSASCNGTSLFTGYSGGYTTTRTAIPAEDGFIVVTINPYSTTSNSLGTWFIRIKKVVPVTLTDNVWTNGESVDFNTHVFTMPVVAGEIYEINWQDSSSGDGTRTGRIEVSVSCNGTSLFTDQSGGYTTNRTTMPSEDGFIVITIKPYSTITSYLGTWAVRVKKVVPVTLTDNVWTDGESADFSSHHFKIPVVAGEIYEINWDDDWGSAGGKTGIISVTATCIGETVFLNQVSGYTHTRTYAPASNGYLNLVASVYNNSSSYFGTWAVRVKKVVPVELTDNFWTDGELVDNSLHHFSIPVTEGEMYAINWQDSSSGDGTRTGRISVSASCNGTSLFTYQTGGYTSTRTAIPTEDGFIVITIEPLSTSSFCLGTWAVRVKNINIVTILSQDDSITAGESKEYSFQATAGITYLINWNDSYQGDGTKTCNIKVSASMGATSFFSSISSSYTSSQTITPTEDGTVTLTVQGYSASSNGTYSIQVAEE